MGVSSNANRSDVVNESFVHKALTVGTSAVEAKVGASVLSNRQEILVFNVSNEILYVGGASVSASAASDNQGVPLSPGEGGNFPFGPNISLWIICGSANGRAVVWELA